MPPKHNFDAELATLEALRDVLPESAAPELVKALNLRNNFLASKAAVVALHHRLIELTPNLAAAFRRFLENPVKADPQCWAKNALAKALAAFEYQDPELFLTGMRHIQLEPVWGGSADTAGTLRGTCALALVQCRELDSHRLLIHLIPLLADKELPVRVDAVRAVVQVGSDSAMLLLRLRAELGSDEPELLGSCYSGVLALEGPGAIPWAARFLSAEDDAAGEAAMAIAQTHTPEAFQLLRTTFAKARDSWFRTAVLSAIALTRQQEATDWLFDLIAKEHPLAVDAQEALCRSAPSAATLDRLRQLGRSCVEGYRAFIGVVHVEDYPVTETTNLLSLHVIAFNFDELMT
jgi:HEAT repeat protein